MLNVSASLFPSARLRELQTANRRRDRGTCVDSSGQRLSAYEQVEHYVVRPTLWADRLLCLPAQVAGLVLATPMAVAGAGWGLVCGGAAPGSDRVAGAHTAATSLLDWGVKAVCWAAYLLLELLHVAACTLLGLVFSSYQAALAWLQPADLTVPTIRRQAPLLRPLPQTTFLRWTPNGKPFTAAHNHFLARRLAEANDSPANPHTGNRPFVFALLPLMEGLRQAGSAPQWLRPSDPLPSNFNFELVRANGARAAWLIVQTKLRCNNDKIGTVDGEACDARNQWLMAMNLVPSLVGQEVYVSGYVRLRGRHDADTVDSLLQSDPFTWTFKTQQKPTDAAAFWLSRPTHEDFYSFLGCSEHIDEDHGLQTRFNAKAVPAASLLRLGVKLLDRVQVSYESTGS